MARSNRDEQRNLNVACIPSVVCFVFGRESLHNSTAYSACPNREYMLSMAENVVAFAEIPFLEGCSLNCIRGWPGSWELGLEN